MFIGERLKKLREEKKLTQNELGKIFNISDATINRYEKELRQPDTETLRIIADYFDVSIDYLLGRSDIRNVDILKTAYVPKKTIELPIIGIVRAGQPLYAEQNILGHYSVDSDLIPSGECFFLKVKGDSMNLSNIIDGQLVMIRRQEEVENGEIALVLVDGEEATIKKFYKNSNIVTLVPNSSNPGHQPRVVDLKTEEFKIIGKVAGSFILY